MSKGGKNMLKVSKVSKTYVMPSHTVEALKDIDFEIDGQQLVCIVGESGSGKSTLMNIMGALDSDFEGDIIINGKSLKEAKNKDLDSYRKNTIGFVFQHFSLINSLNSKQNVELAYDLSNMQNSEKSNKAKSILEIFGLGKHLKHRVNRLSGGQKQRVAISRALANDPDIILADEPTGALDSKTGYQVMEMLKDLSRTKLVVVITHSPELAAEFADTIISIEDGEIIEIESNRLTRKENSVSHPIEAVINNDDKQMSKMSFLRAWKHSFRSMKLRKGRTLATSIGLSIGIIGIGLALALSNGASKTAESQIRQVIPFNMVMVGRNAESDSDNIANYTIAEINELMSLDSRIDGFTVSTERGAYVIGSSLNEEDLEDDNQRTRGASGVTGSLSSTVKNEIAIGRNTENINEIVVSMSTAKNLTDEDVSTLINKSYYLRLMYFSNETGQAVFYNVEFKIVGITSNNTMYDTIYLENLALETIQAERLGVTIDDLGMYMVMLTIDAQAKEMNEVITTINDSQDTYTLVNIAENILDGINTVLDQVMYVLIGFSSISVLVAILMIAVVIMISVIERTQEIGVLRAIGARTQDIRNIFVSESTIIGLLSGIIGVSITFALCSGINKIVGMLIMSQTSNSHMLASVKVADLSFTAAFGLVAACVILSVLSGLIPSVRAAKLDPVKSLKAK